MNKIIQLLVLFLLLHFTGLARDYKINSPDRKNKIMVSMGDTISYTVFREMLIKPGKRNLLLGDSKNKEAIKIDEEEVDINLTEVNLAKITLETCGYLPLYIATPAGLRMIVTAADLRPPLSSFEQITAHIDH